MSASATSVIAINAPLFFVSLEFWSAFFCWFSAMLFRAAPASELFSRNSFRPVLFGMVGTLHFLHAAAVLCELNGTQAAIVNSQQGIQLGLCWAVAVYFMDQRHKLRGWIDGPRLAALLVGTVYFLSRMVFTPALPSGIGAAGCWLVVFSMYYDRPKALVMLPVSFRAFCLLGFLSHMVVAIGSKQVFDGPFFLGSLIQVSQYGFLTGSLLVSHLLGYSAEVWAQRQLLSNTRDRCTKAADDIENTRKLINEAQSHISSTV